MSQEFLHELPANTEAEEFVLGSILLAHRIPPEAECLQASDFLIERHQVIFRTMLALADLGRSIEYLTLAEALDASRAGLRILLSDFRPPADQPGAE